MIISHLHRFIFVAIPKTGTHSVRRALRAHLAMCGHCRRFIRQLRLAGRVVQQLPEDLRSALTLREIEGLSYEEIASVMDCPIGTVRSRIFRAREAVAENLRPLLETSKGNRW